MEKLKRALLNTLKNPLIWLGGAYLILPVDILADAVPGIGTVDDLIAFAIILFIQEMCGRSTNH